MRRVKYTGKVKLYNHNLSYRNFYSGEIGELRPVWLEDGVPGDQVTYTPEVRAYFAPLVFPVLSSLKCRIDVWFVPNRLAWTEWDSFITGGPDNNLSPAYPSVRHLYDSLPSTTKPEFNAWFVPAVSVQNSIFDNLGLSYWDTTTPPQVADLPYDMIPFYDYLLIYDENYRDEEKETSITSYGGIRRDVYDVFQNTTTWSLIENINNGLLRKAWAKDYFTTASLQQQRGGDIPLLSNPMFQYVDGSSFDSQSRSLNVSGSSSTIVGGSGGPGDLFSLVGSSPGTATALESVLTINGLANLRAAAAYLNNNVIGGTRHIEVLQHRYHVVSADARLQRPELVGSTNININIDVVTQTSSTVEDSDVLQPLGDRAGKASIVGRGRSMSYGVQEFGYFMAILHVAPKAAYFQGIRRNLQREDKFDFYTPEFVNTPQQEIRNNEIFLNGTTDAPETGGVFGYTGRYNEYRHHNDEVHGAFRGSLLAWTFARKFSALPSVGSLDFIKVDSTSDGNNRVFAAPDSEDGHIFGVVNNIVSFRRTLRSSEPQF